jgi:hypothetical protein
MSSSSGVDVLEPGSSSGDVLDAPAITARGLYRLKESDLFTCAVFVDRDLACSAKFPCSHSSPDVSSTQFWFLGLLSVTWTVVLEGIDGRNKKFFAGVQSRIYSNNPPLAWVDYSVNGSSNLNPTPVDFSPDAARGTVVRALNDIIGASAHLVEFASHSGNVVRDYVFISLAFALCLFNKCEIILASLPVLGRARSWPFYSKPSFPAIRRRVADSGASAPSRSAHRPLSRTAMAAHSPSHVVDYSIDPCTYLNFLDATRYLKQLKQIRLASSTCVRALWPEQSQQMLDDLLHTGFVFPSGGSLARARPQLDGCCMLLERFEWNVGRFASRPGNRRSINLTADSSPNSGRDLFGIIMAALPFAHVYKCFFLGQIWLGPICWNKCGCEHVWAIARPPP